MTKRTMDLLEMANAAHLNANEKEDFIRLYSEHDTVKWQLIRVAKGFFAEDCWDFFIMRYYDQAKSLIAQAETIGYDYELIYVPAGQTLQGLLHIGHEIRRTWGYPFSHYTGCSPYLYQWLWKDKIKEMSIVDGLGFSEVGYLSVMLLDPNIDCAHDCKNDCDRPCELAGLSYSEMGGLFFCDMETEEQMERATRLMRKKTTLRHLSIAEYLAVDVVRATNGEPLLDAETQTSFIQYGFIDTVVGCFTPRAYLSQTNRRDQKGRLTLDGLCSSTEKEWCRGVRFSIR